MLIKALCEYADKLEESGVKLNTGWSDVGISYRIFLNPDGSISDIVDVGIKNQVVMKNGKTKTESEPRTIKLPRRTEKTAVDSNIIEHRAKYIFGLKYGGGVLTTEDEKDGPRKSHKSFVEKNGEFFKDLESEVCRAYYNFVCRWNPQDEMNNEKLLNLGKSYSTAKFGFGLSGGRGNLEDDEEFRSKYSEYLGQLTGVVTDDTELVTCGITGERLPIARIHDKIRFPGGDKKGCILVGINESAYESYGKTQSYNSNVSEVAMKKYTSALNKLLANEKHRIKINDMDTVIVYFAMKNNDAAECLILSKLLGKPDEQAETKLYDVYDVIKKGKVDYSSLGIDENATFYTVGMTPNSSRICQKFIYRDRFANIIDNLIQHQRDFMVDENAERQVYLSAIAHELVSPKSNNETAPPPLISGIMLAALKGTNYPSALLASVVRRVKTDSDEDKKHYIKLNSTRAGIIKACINRKLRNSGQKEEITMAWDENNRNPAYICGGLFAVYEKIQREAAGVDLNRTIKDTYFASACSRPSVIFPKLAQLSQNHLRKLEDGRVIYFNKLIGGLIDGLDGRFPQTLDLDSQGRFIIGYYQMNQRLYTPNTGKND